MLPRKPFTIQQDQQRKNILEAAGFKVEEVWECEWNQNKKSLKNRKQLKQHARDQSIVIRDAMFGGRTEGLKSYHCCNADEKIHYFDVVSLYPTVNALDPYAVGFKRYEHYENVDQFLFDLEHDTCFGFT